MATDYYGVLGLSQGASDKDIKTAYRRKARDLHPDVNPDPGAKEEFQQVSRAYEALTDPDKRRIVDLGGDPFETGGGGGGNPFGGGAGFGGLGDIMDAFFGGQPGAAGHGRGPRSRVRRGQDALIRLEVELAEEPEAHSSVRLDGRIIPYNWPFDDDAEPTREQVRDAYLAGIFDAAEREALLARRAEVVTSSEDRWAAAFEPAAGAAATPCECAMAVARSTDPRRPETGLWATLPRRTPPLVSSESRRGAGAGAGGATNAAAPPAAAAA